MLLRSLFAGAGVAAVLTLTATGAAAVAVNQCANAPFGMGSLACVVENNTVFTGLDESVFDGKTPGTVRVNGAPGESDVEAVLNYALGNFTDISPVATKLGDKGGSGFQISLAPERDVPIRPTRGGGPKGGSTSFTWAYSGEAPLAYMTVEAGPNFAIFDIAGMVSGFADTEEMLVNPAGKAHTISQISFWSASLSAVPEVPKVPDVPDRADSIAVSEPASIGFAIAGIAGLVALGRLNRNKTGRKPQLR